MIPDIALVPKAPIMKGCRAQNSLPSSQHLILIRGRSSPYTVVPIQIFWAEGDKEHDGFQLSLKHEVPLTAYCSQHHTPLLHDKEE